MPTEMQHQAMGYDRAATMFSPDGHLLQVEYAEKAVRLGSSSVGLVCKDGVVIVADRRIRDKLVASESANKIFEIDSHMMATAAGITSDARVLIDNAQVLAQQNRVTYDSPVDPVSVIRMIADKMQMATQYGGARPFGITMMMAGIDKGKAHLYSTDVTGGFLAYRANAIGENDEEIKETLRRDFKDSMSCEEGVSFVLKIFKDLLVKNFDLDRFDVGIIKLADGKLQRMHGNDLKSFLK